MKYDAPCSHSAASQPRRASQIIEARARCICTAVLASALVARLMTKNVTGLIAVDKPIPAGNDFFLPIYPSWNTSSAAKMSHFLEVLVI